MRTILFFACFILSLVVYAQRPRPSKVPASPHPYHYVQPDGDTITLRLHGDERMHYRTTVDGYEVLQNKRGYYMYAKRSCCGKIKATRKQAHDASKRSVSEEQFLVRKGLQH